jgi:hypothetical protein
MDLLFEHAIELLLWAASVVFMAGIYVTKIRELEGRVKDNEQAVRNEAEKAHTGRADLWRAWSDGPPAVLAHLESIEKNQSRQERRVEAIAAAVTELSTTIIERLAG